MYLLKNVERKNHHRHRCIKRYFPPINRSKSIVKVVEPIHVGIGLAIATYLLKASCNVIVVARSLEPLEQLRQDYPDQTKVIVGDLGDLSQDLGQKMVNAALSCWGRLDGLVVNHGSLHPVKRVADTDAKEWRDGFSVNLFSAVAIVKLKVCETSDLLN